ncbi:MAG: hypothetical protein JXR61_04410 [Prolixibacteraceae bacterium]|nr:hypothetical protein [Prolixibacteraceae bacterium]
MFTVGIFSTHIPYIAFVLFYAYFLVTGVNKAVSGEISSGEEFCKTEIYASELLIQSKTEIDTYHYFCTISNYNKNNDFEELHFIRKLKSHENSVKIPTEYFSASLFNRPPPAA